MRTIIIIGIILALALTGFIIWVALLPNGGCPAHTVATVTGWMPISTGKSIIMTPIISCQGN
jgi:hypothetical protein